MAGWRRRPGAPWEHIALVLFGFDPKSAEAWRTVVMELLRLGLPPKVRVLLPTLEVLPDGLEPKVNPGLRVDQPPVELAGMFDELLAHTPRDTPGARASVLIGQLLIAIGRGDATGADEAYKEALNIVVAENWPGVRVGVELAYSQALTQRGASDRAMAHMERGFQAAQEATQKEDHQGPRLEAQTLLSIAGAQAIKGELALAAQSCAAAALCAQAIGDALLTLESCNIQ